MPPSPVLISSTTIVSELPSSSTTTQTDSAGTQPRTADSEARERWSDDEEVIEDDPGLFTFLRPSTGISSYSRPMSIDPPDTGMFSINSTGTLSPAAAYALASVQGSIRGAPNSAGTMDSAAPRGSWPREEERLNTADSTDQEGVYWDGKSEGSSGSGVNRSAAPIMLHQLHRGMTSRSADEKMIAEDDAYRKPPLGFEDDYLDDDEEDSPYPEVRASVSNIDDQDMPCLTFRSWFLGILFSVLIAAINTFFAFRYPAPFVTPIIVQVLSYPLGKILAYTLPTQSWRVPYRLRPIFGDSVSFNPGPFNIKEHTVIIIMANSSITPSFGINFSVASEKFYGITQGVGFDILLLLSVQLLGLGMAGMCRRFLVWPAALIWPQNLVFCTLLNTLHAEDDDGSEGGLTRTRFFWYVLSGAFVWYILPGFLFQALSVFSFVCWAAPNNRVVNQLFGVSSGLGMSILTFDWSQIAYLGSPLVTPWWAEVNIFVGFVLVYWIMAPILYYNNVWFSAYLPISTSQVFDRFGSPYDIHQVVDAGTAVLNVTAYAAYSPLYLPITFATVYGVGFAVSTASVVHTALHYGPSILKKLTKVEPEEDDIHYKLMKAYPDVPDWWYLTFLALCAGISIVTITVWETDFPVWAMIVALLVGFVYVLPGGYIFAMTNQLLQINLIVELMAGYMMPGRALANMVYTSQSMLLALQYAQDLKLGHYMKIPPRATFFIQVVAVSLSCLAQIGVKEWLIMTVPDLCDPRQASLLSCPNTTVFYGSSIIWGLIGPARQFGIGMVYNPILYWLLVGAVLPVPFYLLGRRYPDSWVKYVNIPVLFTGAIYMPPATGINYSSWFLFGFIFQYWMRRTHFRWWSKFNFILSAGLDSGTILSGLFIFFALQLPKGGTISVNWWGNSVFENTADWNGVAFLDIPPEGFGPTTGW